MDSETDLVMPTEHRRRLDENGNSAHERASDIDIWARLSTWGDRYKAVWVFWLLAGGVVTYITKNYLGPLAEVSVVQGQVMDIRASIDTLKRGQEAGTQERRDLANILKIVVRIECLNLPHSDRAKYGIDCSTIP